MNKYNRKNITLTDKFVDSTNIGIVLKQLLYNDWGHNW